MRPMQLVHWYLPLKFLHVGLVLLSGALFALRGLAVLRGQAWAGARPVRLASYGIDTLLLAAGSSLWWLLGLNPAHDLWLGTKLLLLLVYVVLGSYALKRARSRAGHGAAYAAALACYAYLLSVAHWHHPLGLFSRLGAP